MAKEIKSTYKVTGIMAGSSMDGLDLVDVLFEKDGDWQFEILNCSTFSYDDEIGKMLKEASSQSFEKQQLLDETFGVWIANRMLEFNGGKTELVAVHGHTVVHNPVKGISWQLGRGDVIAKMTGLEVVSDFRSEDVRLGGQGAPLVPVGDFSLFSEFNASLNLGGIANISLRDEQMAWDICPCNQVLNHFARRLDKPFDRGGVFAKKGTVNAEWLSRIKALKFFDAPPPKSLPNQYIAQSLLDEINPLEGLRSYTEFIASCIADVLNTRLENESQVLVTGGGAFNTFLIELLRESKTETKLVVPSNELVSFKEAIVFAFLGLLRMRNEVNVLSSVTGGEHDTSSGVIHSPK